MRINHNISSLNAWRQLQGTDNALSKSLERLSSGLRINRAADDAAGLAISEKMRAQIRGLDQAIRNAQDGISLIQTAEGAMNEHHLILQRIRELASQAANGTNTELDRTAIQEEVDQLLAELDRIGNTTEFNTMKLLNGNLQGAGGITGANYTAGAQVLEQVQAVAVSGAAVPFAAGNYSGVDFTVKETIVIDGHTITIDWDQLATDAERNLIAKDYSGTAMTDSEKRDIKAALNRMVNAAIDEYNATNAAGAKVAHVKIYENTSGELVMESGIKGEESQILIEASADGVLGLYFTDGTTNIDVSGDNRIVKAIQGTETLKFQINGVQLQTAALAAAAAGTSADTVAADLQTKINDAINTYNTNAGLVKGDAGFIEQIRVDADNGRLKIWSESGPIVFSEQEGFTTVQDLGLLQAQTEAASQGGMTFQIGANRGQTISFSIADVRTAALGISGIDVTTVAGASAALDRLDAAINTVSQERSKLGALQNRLEHTITNLGVASENLTAAESRIRDVDMAREMMAFTRSQILVQAGTAMMAQANMRTHSVLQLLG